MRTADLYKVVADLNCEYVAGMLSMVAVYEGSRVSAELARYLRVPIEVALYAVRQVRAR